MTKRQFNIALMRTYAGLNQQQVADALGIKKARYGDWERETREINLRDAIRLADLFGCTLDELANHKVQSRPSTSPDEQRMLDVYRDAPQEQRYMIDALIDAAARQMDESALKEAGNA